MARGRKGLGVRALGLSLIVIGFVIWREYRLRVEIRKALMARDAGVVEMASTFTSAIVQRDEAIVRAFRERDQYIRERL